MIGWLAVAVYVLALVYAAYSDLRTYEIPNWVPLVSFVCFFPLAWAADWDATAMAWNVGAGALLLVVGFGMYLLRMAGAGDIKLASVMGLLVGPVPVAMILIVAALLLGAAAFGRIVQRRAEPLAAAPMLATGFAAVVSLAAIA